jgi:hypothetical protein
MGASGENDASELAVGLELDAPHDAQNRWPSPSWAPQTWQYATATSFVPTLQMKYFAVPLKKSRCEETTLKRARRREPVLSAVRAHDACATRSVHFWQITTP